MAPANAATVALGTLSPRETELLILAMQCFAGGEPKLDYPKFAAAAGLASPKGGMDSWYRIRRKLGLIGTPAKTAPKKEEDGTDAEPGADAAVSTPKRARTKRKAVKKEEAQEQDGGDGIKVENDSSSEPAEPSKKKRAAGRRRADTAAPQEDKMNGPF